MLQSLIASAQKSHREGAWDDAHAHYESALAEIETEGNEEEAANVLRWLGDLHRDRGDFDAAEARFAASRAAAERAGEPALMASALNSAATVKLLRGRLGEATDLFLEARALAEEARAEQIVAMVDQNLGTVANIQGNAAVALLSYRSALHRYRHLGDDLHATRALNNMGMAHVDLGEWEAADRCFTEAGQLAERTAEVRMTGVVALNHTELHLRRRRYEDALESLERSLEIFQRLRTKPSIAAAYKFYGVLYRNTGKPRQADTHFGLALGMAEACGNPLLQAEIQLEWSILHLEEERRQEAVLYLNRALRIFRQLEAEGQVLDIERRLGRLREIYIPAVRALGARRDDALDSARVGHEQRVADYATKLAREVGVEGWDLTWLEIGALVHELGRVAAEDEVASPAHAEPVRGRAFATIGDALARHLEFPDEVRPIIRGHREAWDGAGYPDRLSGGAIPLGARVVAIADVYDTLTAPGGSRRPLTGDEALEVMSRESAGRFDPRLQRVFGDMLARGHGASGAPSAQE